MRLLARLLARSLKEVLLLTVNADSLRVTLETMTAGVDVGSRGGRSSRCA